jgi:hypothetical protein
MTTLAPSAVGPTEARRIVDHLERTLAPDGPAEPKRRAADWSRIVPGAAEPPD